MSALHLFQVKVGMAEGQRVQELRDTIGPTMGTEMAVKLASIVEQLKTLEDISTLMGKLNIDVEGVHGKLVEIGSVCVKSHEELRAIRQKVQNDETGENVRSIRRTVEDNTTGENILRELATLKSLLQSGHQNAMSNQQPEWVDMPHFEIDLGTLEDLTLRYRSSGYIMPEIEIWDIFTDIVNGFITVLESEPTDLSHSGSGGGNFHEWHFPVLESQQYWKRKVDRQSFSSTKWVVDMQVSNDNISH